MQTEKKDALTNLAQMLQEEVERQSQPTSSTPPLVQPKVGENVVGSDGEIVTLNLHQTITKK